jgi:cation transport ATPase
MNLLKTLTVALSFAAAAPLAAFAQTQPAQTAPIAADVVVSVNGLVCDFCAQAVNRSLRRRAEVNDVRVNLTTKLVSIDFRPNQNLDDATIRDIITRAGYSVTEIRRTAPAS